jgi:serine/threonine-protein kinase RsbW
MDKRRILIVEDNDEMRTAFEKEFRELGHDVLATADRVSGLKKLDLDEFDVVLSDLTDDGASGAGDLSKSHRERLLAAEAATESSPSGYHLVKAFRLDAVNYHRPAFEQDELTHLVDRALSVKRAYDEKEVDGINTREMIDFELPSDISLMNSVLQYLIVRVSTLGVINPERSNLFVALDEAFVNAVKHGNRNDVSKHIRITADLSADEARFTVEDEGEGFNVQAIPDPCDPENLFKSSGRGVLLIYNIMDEVKYNARGNRLTMVKRPEGSVEPELIEVSTPKDKPVHN